MNRTHTERELVEGCVQNDRIYQEALYRRYLPTMMQMCMRYTDDRQQAMEIVNNGMLRVFKKIDTFEFKGSLEGWVRKLVYHSLSDYYKKHSKYMHFLVFEERDEIVRQEPIDNLYLEDLLRMVRQLPDNTQEVFRLYAIEGYTHTEIGQRLGLSEGTSKWHLSKARKILKQMIQQQNNSSQLYAG